jgi:hypothetical protein
MLSRIWKPYTFWHLKNIRVPIITSFDYELGKHAHSAVNLIELYHKRDDQLIFTSRRFANEALCIHSNFNIRLRTILDTKKPMSKSLIRSIRHLHGGLRMIEDN